MMGLRGYLALAVVVLVLHYLVPYTVLHEPRGLALATYWTLLSLIWVVVTLYYMRRRW